MPPGGERVDQRLNYLGVVANDKPGGFLAGSRGRREPRGFLPANLVAGVCDGLCFPWVVGPCLLYTSDAADDCCRV